MLSTKELFLLNESFEYSMNKLFSFNELFIYIQQINVLLFIKLYIYIQRINCFRSTN